MTDSYQEKCLRPETQGNPCRGQNGSPLKDGVGPHGRWHLPVPVLALCPFFPALELPVWSGVGAVSDLGAGSKGQNYCENRLILCSQAPDAQREAR